MRLPLLGVLIAALWSAPTPLLAQHASPAQADAGKPRHGIIRAPKPTTAEPRGGKTAEPQGTTTEAAAAAIAAAIKSAEEPKKPEPPRPARPAERRVKPRRYEVRWPSQRLEVKWETPDARVTLSWQPADVPLEPARDGRGPQP